MSTYPLRRGAAMLTGCALIAAETTINLSHVRVPTDIWWEQPLVLAVAVAGLAQAVAVTVLGMAISQRRWALAAITFLGLAAAVAFSFSTTYERTALAREARALAADRANLPGRVAASRLDSLEEIRDRECKTRGPECRRREADVLEARGEVIAKGRQVSTQALGRFEMVPELALPVMLMLLGFAFIAAVEQPKRRRSSAADSAQTSFPTDMEPPPAARFQPDADDYEAADVTGREAQVASFYRAHVAKHGRAPRHRDVVAATGLPKSTASRYMRRVKQA
jgi:hypothetical protein